MFKKSLALLLSLLLAASPIANAAIPTAMQDMSTTAASNTPAGSESPTNADDYLRAIQAILRSTNAKGSDIASASTIDIGAATGEFVDVTGTTTITSLGTVAAGIVRTVRFTGALTLTHNATSLILPGSANITTANGDVAQFRSLGSGNWKCVGYIKQSGEPVGPYVDTNPLVVGSSDATKKVRVEADGLTTATTRVITMPDFNVNLGITGESEDTSPDSNADYVHTYDASATGLKKVLLGRAAAPTQGTAQASTSGTAVNFTGIPSWAKRITLSFAGVSLSGSDDILIRLGDSGGLENTGYLSASSLAGESSIVSGNYSNSFGITAGAGAAVWHGSVTFTLIDAATNTWAASGTFARSDTPRLLSIAGSKALSATLDRVGVLPAGSNTFDAGSINIQYE